MRFHLIAINICLLTIWACKSSDNFSKKDLLDSFHKTSAYINYLEEQPIVSQVVVIIKVDGIDDPFSFPNPFVANLFADFLDKNTDLNYSSSY